MQKPMLSIQSQSSFSFFDLWEALGKPFQIEAKVVPNELPSLDGCVPFEVLHFVFNQREFLKFRVGDLINTSRSMEDTYIDLLEKIFGNKKYWVVRTINSVTICIKHRNSNSRDNLEQSNTKFIWELRDVDKGDIFTEECRRSAEHPKGFDKRTEGLGMIVKDWASQLEILGHLSTGGSMNHCGWNSCLESLSTGVPIAAWPTH
ncbi:hypothetical protein EZV62_005212 [Acer yangbiense]|uniref:Uncharacterized protein n=1 Tax=Acer yangbiense TaxID=1000413 RepID=A0A5C7ILJ1_9ROSI|nr:hypothetical protein EZV62_005212 [Acer yangbiense]